MPRADGRVRHVSDEQRKHEEEEKHPPPGPDQGSSLADARNHEGEADGARVQQALADDRADFEEQI